MNYEEAVAYIEDIPRFTTKNSLDHTRECLRRLGDPQRKFRVIHVAGTNGKGSTCAFITSVLREAGYSCGLFTSPHLVEINERFQINEEVIDDDTFLRAFEKVKKLSDELVAEGSYHPTYFETLLLMGMVIFAEAGVDYVTLETGLGGRLQEAGIKVVSIEWLRERARLLTGEPQPIEFTDRVVAVVRYRDGSVIDVVHQVKE